MAAQAGKMKDDRDEEAGIFGGFGTTADCLLCCERIVVYSVGECDHREVCHSCILRLRRFYEDFRCPSCTVELREVWFTTRKAPFSELSAGPVAAKIVDLGVLFDDPALAENVRALLYEVRCPECLFHAADLRQLQRHVGSAHGRFFCDVCLTSRKVFLREQRLYSKQNLRQHMLRGDNVDIAVKKSEGCLCSARVSAAPRDIESGHPECKFCRVRFYDTDELFYHMRDTHFYCTICAGRAALKEFFAIYSDLEAHYAAQHFLCPNPECLEKRNIVFADRLELQLHEAEVHAEKKMRAFEKKKARTLEVSFAVKRSNRFGEGIDDDSDRSWTGNGHVAQAGFPALGSGLESRESRGSRERRVRGRGAVRTPPAGDLLVSGEDRASAAGAARVPSSQTVSLPPRGRGPPAHQAGGARVQPEGKSRAYSFCEFDMQTGSLLRVECSREDYMRRNQTLLELLRARLSADQLEEFRKESRHFRAGEVSTGDFVSHLFGIMDAQAAQGVLRELIAVMPDVSLQRGLADAWLVRVALERNFPALDGQRGARSPAVRRSSFSEVVWAPQIVAMSDRGCCCGAAPVVRLVDAFGQAVAHDDVVQLCPECGERVDSAEWETHAVFHREQRMQRFHRGPRNASASGRRRDGKKNVILRWG